MSTLYVVDMFGQPFSSAKILDVRGGPNAVLNGGVIVRVPDYISVQDPADVTDLLTKKHQGMLAYYAGYTNVTYDDLMDLVNVDTAALNVAGNFGLRNNVSIAPLKLFRSSVVALTGPAPAQAVFTWETYSVQTSDPATGRVEQTYVEESSSVSTFMCSVSFDNGAHWYSTWDGALLNIPVVGQGTQFLIEFENMPGRPLRVGSWAVLY